MAESVFVSPADAVASEEDAAFELEFLDASRVRNREPLLGCAGVRFEDVEPVRGFGWARGQRHFPGWWWSATTGRHVGYESWLERDHAMLLDFDPEVVGFSSQPFSLRWREAGRWRRRTPDFFARRADGHGVVVDVRAAERIEPADALVFGLTARACAPVGWLFVQVGTLDPVRRANLRWLARYRHHRHAGRPGSVEEVLAAFTRPCVLFAGVERAGDRLAVLPVVFHLLWRQLLVTDLTGGPLGGHSVVGRARTCASAAGPAMAEAAE